MTTREAYYVLRNRAAYPPDTVEYARQIVDTYERHRENPGLTVDQGTTLMYVCIRCGMETHTDDLSVIGRNCWASDFERAHVMAPVIAYAFDNDGKWACDTHGAHDRGASHTYAECPMSGVPARVMPDPGGSSCVLCRLIAENVTGSWQCADHA